MNMHWLVGVLVAVVGCGGTPFAVAAGDDGGSAWPDVLSDVVPSSSSPETGDVVRDAATVGETPTLPDASERDASADVAGDVGMLCTPLVFPLPAPSGCTQDYGPAIAAPGRLWLLQREALPTACWSYALAGSERCEDCAEHFTCKCLAPLLAAAGDPWTGPAGAGCVDSKAAGPYFSQ